ncbi:MAG: glucose-1-phosphate adenylyltransferase subunit GlgD [Oscillospiraceae bacterium]|nr:glucose-1-phosphate adenylyltransferase subunit GlgD [Oscillospiraceae bacterium]
MNDLHGIVLAYRSNPALGSLTQYRTTCSIPYGGRYRIIDFVLSSFVNAGITDVGLVVHSNYQSLLDHVGSGKDWELSKKHGGLRILPPFSYSQGIDESAARGRMDALVGIRSYLENIRQDYVALAWGDIVANLPIDEAFEQHLKTKADITAICSPDPVGNPTDCTYFTVGDNNCVTEVSVHPIEPSGCETLECYILSKSLLLNLVDYAAAHRIHSFSEGVLQSMYTQLTIMPYLYDGYVARFHSVTSYFDNSMDLLKPEVQADLFDPERPIRTKDHSNPSTYYGPNARSRNSFIADGCIIDGSVENSILFRGVHIGTGARITNCILMQAAEVQDNSELNAVIADKNVLIRSGRTLMGHESYPLTIVKNTVI